MQVEVPVIPKPEVENKPVNVPIVVAEPAQKQVGCPGLFPWG